jgi:hypothetical protein
LSIPDRPHSCIRFLLFYLGKSTLDVLYSFVDFMSTFSKVKVKNNLSDGLLILTIDLLKRVRVNPSP